MSEEDAEFLQKAIKHALSNMVDHHKIVEESIPKLSSTDGLLLVILFYLQFVKY